MTLRSVVLALALLCGAEAKVYFKEQFDKDWRSRWVESTEWKASDDMGAWDWTAGEYYADADDKGIQTSQDAKFYGLSAMMDEPVSGEKKDLVIQYSVKHEQKIDCGGAYIKLLPKADQASFGGDTPYGIMFGPDICGSTRRTHVIFHYDPKDENLLVNREIKCENDQKSHLYTLHVKADGTYEVFIDDKSKQTGSLEDDWDFLPAKEIKDPELSKPADWVDEKQIPDPSDVKPEGYDDIPAQIPDPEAERPDDWDDEDDGEWEPPMVDNPDYHGPWKQKMMENPDYKGEWVHPMIPNPDYKEDPEIAVRCKDCAMVGFELWQVKSGTIFDDIIVTDSLEEARQFAQETFFAKQEGEAKMFEEKENARREQEAADRKAAEEQDEDDDEVPEHDEL